MSAGAQDGSHVDHFKMIYICLLWYNIVDTLRCPSDGLGVHEAMSVSCVEIFMLAERSHRQFLDVIQFEIDRLKVRDINSVRALILLNIGESEMTVSELVYRGCYLGTNVSYNLKKLTEAGYIDQLRSTHDRRVIMVRNSTKGMEICTLLRQMTNRNSAKMMEESLQPEGLVACAKTLGALQRFWARTAHRPDSPISIAA